MTGKLSAESLDRVCKLLSLTSSDNDNEALLAARRANEILKKHSTAWHQLLSLPSTAGQAKYDAKEWGAPGTWNHARRAQESQSQFTAEYVGEMFEALDGTRFWNDFIESLYSQWETKKRLSPRQLDALEKTYIKQRNGF